MRQYEIWWAKLPGPAGERPVLLLSRDDAYAVLNKFVVAEITTTIRSISTEVRLGKREGVKDCAANFDNLRTVSRSWLVRRMGAVQPSRYEEVKAAVGYSFQWPELIPSDLPY